MNHNPRIPRFVLAAAVLLAFACSVAAQPLQASAKASGVPDKFIVDFAATVRPDIKGDLDLDLTGTVTHSYPMTRIEFVHPLTMEQIALIIDGDQRLATLLYPDTLNGFSFKYDGRYYEDWPGGFVGYLSDNPDSHPPRWSKKVAEIDASSAIEITLSKDGVVVVCSVNAEGRPTGMEVTTPRHSAKLSFTNYVFPETLDGSLFAVPPDFAIEKVDTLEDDAALPL